MFLDNSSLHSLRSSWAAPSSSEALLILFLGILRRLSLITFLSQWRPIRHLNTDSIFSSHRTPSTWFVHRNAMLHFWHVDILNSITAGQYQKQYARLLNQLSGIYKKSYQLKFLPRSYYYFHNFVKHRHPSFSTEPTGTSTPLSDDTVIEDVNTYSDISSSSSLPFPISGLSDQYTGRISTRKQPFPMNHYLLLAETFK